MSKCIRFRFSIRVLLFTVMGCCVLLSVIGERANRQANAVDEIIANGGYVYFGEESFEMSPRQIQNWFISVERVALRPSKENPADDQISIVARLPSIKHLDVCCGGIWIEPNTATFHTEGGITDVGLGFIVEQLQHLQSVDIIVDECSDMAIDRFPSQLEHTKVIVSKLSDFWN